MPETLEARIARRKQGGGEPPTLEQRIAARKGRPVERGAPSNVVRGVMTGLADAGYGLAKGAAWAGDKVAFGKVDLGVRDALDRSEAEAAEFYDPQGKAGSAGRFFGGMLGEGAITLAGGMGIGRAIAAKAPISRIGQALAAGRKGRFGQRVAANSVPFLPVDAVLGAGAAEEGESRIKSAALYAGLGLAGAGVIEGAASGIRAIRARRAPVVADETVPPVEADVRRLPSGPIVTPPPAAIHSFDEGGYRYYHLDGVDPFRNPEMGSMRVAIEGEGKGVVDAVEIPPAMRGKGLGKALYRRALQDFSLRNDPATITKEANRVRESLVRSGDAVVDGGYLARATSVTPPPTPGPRLVPLDPPAKPKHADSLSRPGFAAPAVMAQIASGGVGALAGAASSPDDPAVGAVGGAALAVGGAAAARAALRHFKPKPAAASIVTPPPSASAQTPRPSIRTPGKPENSGKLFNKSLQTLDPEGRRMWEIEEEILVNRGEVKRPVSDAEVRRLASAIDVPFLVGSNASKMNSVELMALGTRIQEDRAALAAVQDRLDQGGASMSKQARQELESEHDATLTRLLHYDSVFNKAGSEAGRALRILGKIAVKRGTVEAATHAARKALGVPELGDDITNDLAKVMSDHTLDAKAKELALAKVIQGYQKQPLYRVVLDMRRWSLLSAPATQAVNILGNVMEAANRNLVVTPTAAALDRVFAKLTGAERSVSIRGRGAWGRGFKHGAGQVNRATFEGIDPEDPLAALNRQRADYVASLGLSERDGTEAWRRTLAAGARVLQKSGDIVYGMMSAADKPLYHAALKASLSERSALRAVREGYRPGTPEFDQRMAALMLPENVSKTDATMAVVEALDDVFKTPTKVAAVMRAADRISPPLGAIAQWQVPFANTPTNLVRKAIENTPGLGAVLNETQARKLRRTLADLDVPSAEIAREVRRLRMVGTAKQLTTGAGMVAAGFVMTMAGVLTGDYVPPMGQDDVEREDADIRRLTGQGPLTVKIGDKAHSLAAFAQFAPAIALGNVLAMESKRDVEEGDGNVFARVGGRTLTSTGRTIMDFPLLTGAKNMVTMLGGGSGNRAAAAGREIASFIPYGAGVASIARALDPVGRRDPETIAEGIKERLPVLRESVAPKVGVMGEVIPRTSVIEGLLSPTRPQRINTGRLYDVLQETGTYPSAAGKLDGETKHEYATRRISEGAVERQLLEGLINGDDAAWDYVAPSARDRFEQDGDWSRLLKSALSRQRSALTQARKEMLEMQGQ